MNGASATLRNTAAEFCTAQLELFSKHPQQGRVSLTGGADHLSV
jgi:hypothetical protein